MTTAFFNEAVIKAEINYRRERAIADSHPKFDLHGSHRHWWRPLGRESARPGLRSQALLG